MTEQEKQKISKGLLVITKKFDKLVKDMESGKRDFIVGDDYTPQYKRELEIYFEGVCFGNALTEKKNSAHSADLFPKK